MGVINVLRVLSGLAEIPVASSPLWGRTCHASHDELARLSTLMPRLAEAFKADTTAQAKGGEKAGGKSCTDSCDRFSPVLSATPIRTPSPAFCSVATAIESNAAFDLQVTCIECNATATVTARRLYTCGRHSNQVSFKGSLHSHDCPLYGIRKQSKVAQFPTLGRSFTLCNGALTAKRI
jgi:hypothetical protein